MGKGGSISEGIIKKIILNHTCVMLKALMPLAVYSIGVLFKKDQYNSETIGNMIAISIPEGIAAYRVAKFDTWGVILQPGAFAFEATRLMIIQILLTSKGRRNRHKVKEENKQQS
ncbi:hypothetical protein RJ641_006888 [Dillenia turbinata]|uniref:Uncharacterized protein n=1 Tax=Dillenia turbinata TaxID=194707 RepID=A0AAN8VFC9_9MAGN